jgi:hypothetical protein
VPLGPGARNFVEGELGPGGDDQVVVRQGGSIRQLQCVAAGIDALDALGHKLNAFLLQRRPDRKGDGLALAPSHRQPGVGGHELEVVDGIDDRDAVRAAQLFAQLVGSRHAAGAGAKNDNVGHGDLLFAGSRLLVVVRA